MDPRSPGLWLLPTFNRPTTNLPKFFAAAVAAGMTTPGIVIVDRADYDTNKQAYDALDLPTNWQLSLVQGGSLAAATEEAYAAIGDDLSWYGWLADDLRPVTPGWDVKCIEALTPYGFISTDDDFMASTGKANGATLWSGELLKAVGYFFCPGLYHFFLDDIWEEIGRMTGCWTVLNDVLVRHVHAAKSGNVDSTVAHTMKRFSEDTKAFEDWRQNDLVPAAERVLALMERHGVKMVRPDLTGVSVMIATPCGSGKYDRGYVNSLMATEKLLAQFGAKVRWAELPHCSDVALARNKLFGNFLRTSDTHLFMIDDDMTFRPIDVATLLLAKRDFVAVAGVRKVYPPSFAVNVSDDFGRPIPIKVDPETGFLSASGIGMAFTCLSRAGCERMAQVYADLGFDGADGRAEFGVFNPMIVNRRYLSEDFAYAHRWRQLGGEIWVAGEISLGHTGSFTWDGAWGDQLRAKMAEEANAA